VSESESAELGGTGVEFDGLKISLEQEYYEERTDVGSDTDQWWGERGTFNDEEFGHKLAEMVQKMTKIKTGFSNDRGGEPPNGQ